MYAVVGGFNYCVITCFLLAVESSSNIEMAACTCCVCFGLASLQPRSSMHTLFDSPSISSYFPPHDSAYCSGVQSTFVIARSVSVSISGPPSCVWESFCVVKWESEGVGDWVREIVFV